jgi:hypothetical protein
MRNDNTIKTKFDLTGNAADAAAPFARRMTAARAILSPRLAESAKYGLGAAAGAQVEAIKCPVSDGSFC